MMHTTHSGSEKLNMLAAGLITALSVHALFCVAAMPAAMGASHDTILLAAAKALRILWNIAGIGAAAYLIMEATGMINGRSYAKARLAGFGALLLPLLGSPGLVTVFALLPIGLLTTYLLKQTDWQVLFQDWMPVDLGEVAVQEEPEAVIEA
ncbi:MAG: hypothetical protein EOP84_05460 [Verrucomicrobiaceae bacterium]|nr:MAG: hypothetical protein EOP84_05460 [Verrucomicrobiaceae bacterium]